MVRESKEVYVYSDDCTLVGHYLSINDTVSSLGIPKTTIVKNIDIRLYDIQHKKIKSKRVYSNRLKQFVFFRSVEL